MTGRDRAQLPPAGEVGRAPDPGDDRLRAVLEALPEPVLVALYPPGRSVPVLAALNSTACSSLGRPREELLGADLASLVPEPVADAVRAWCARAHTTGATSEDDPFPGPLVEGLPGSPVRAVVIPGGICLAWRRQESRAAIIEGLARAREDFRLLAEYSSDAVFRMGPDWTLQWLSPSVAGLLGWAPSQLQGTPGRDLLHPEDLEVVRMQARAIQAGSAVSFVARLRTAGGDFRWISARLAAIPGAHGEIAGWAGGLRDVDAEKRTELELAASEARFRLLAENVSDLVFDIAPDNTYRWISPSVERILGWPVDRMLGRSGADFIHPEDLPGVVAARTHPVAGESSVAEFRMRATDGTYRWVSGTSHELHDDSGALSGRVVALQLVPERVRAAQQAEQRERERLRATLDAGFDPHLGLDACRGDSATIVDFVITDANRAACAYFQRDDLVGSRLADLLRTWGGAAMLARLATVVDSGEPLVLDDFPHPPQAPGRQRHLDIRAIRIGDGLSLTWRDVSSRHDAAEALALSEEHYRLLAEHASDVVFRADNHGTLTWVSPSVTADIGWEPEELVGVRLVELSHPDDLAELTATHAHLADEGLMVHAMRIRTKPGDYRWIEVRGEPVTDAEGHRRGRAGSWRDITDEVAAREALAASERQYRLVAENASDVVFRVSPQAIIEWLSPSVVDVLGWAPSELVGTPVTDLIHPEDAADLLERARNVRLGEAVILECRARRVEGNFCWIAIVARLVLDDAGEGAGLIGSFRDVGSERAAREALAASEERFRLAMDYAPSGMAVVDLDRRFVEVNPALCRMLGRDEAWMLGHRVADVVHPDDDALDLRMRTDVLSGRAASATREKRLLGADGAVVWVEHSVGLLRGSDGRARAFVSQFKDITDARTAREELQFLATHDPLTRLANRSELLTQMDRILSGRSRAGSPLAVLFIDLDGLKGLNDTFGHSAGDTVIVEVANRISSQVRSGDLVARLGGDEYVVVLPGVRSTAAAQRVAAKIQEGVAPPITTDMGRLTVTLSIGIAVATPGENPDQTIRHADLALYRAKNTGRDRWVTYDPILDERAGGRPPGTTPVDWSDPAPR